MTNARRVIKCGHTAIWPYPTVVPTGGGGADSGLVNPYASPTMGPYRPNIIVNSNISIFNIGDWWLGGNDKRKEGHYVWAHSGLAIPYGSPHWGHGRPNNIVNSHSEDEDCLEFANNIQAWNDEHCSAYDHFICEKPVW